MRPELKIAWRYLFAKKSHNAINIVSAVSAAGVCIATAALVCVLSIMNGFNVVIEGMFSYFDPQLVIVPTEGKLLRTDAQELQSVAKMPEVATFSPTIEETAMVMYREHQTAAMAKGVSADFQQLVDIDSIIVDGSYTVFDGTYDRCVMGWALADQLSVSARYGGAIKLYAPKRVGRVNMMRPDRSLNQESVYMAGTFAVNQTQYDDHYLLVSLECARRLFDYSDNEASAIELRLTPMADTKRVKRHIASLLGDKYQVRDRYEQQEEFFRISRIEKMLCTLLLAFILMIASFNIVGSLSMLILDKRDDIRVLSHMGANDKMIRRIFLFEGWMISLLGAIIGLVIGVSLCLAQQEFGLLKLGNGYEYAVSVYPVAVQVGDILLISVIVLALGFVAAWYPTRTLSAND